MSAPPEVARLARSLKGAPVAVLLALALHGEPATSRELGRLSGYSLKWVRQALVCLEEEGLVRYGRADCTWTIVVEATLLQHLARGMRTAVRPAEPDDERRTFRPGANFSANGAGGQGRTLPPGENFSTLAPDDEGRKLPTGENFSAIPPDNEGRKLPARENFSAIPPDNEGRKLPAGENFSAAGPEMPVEGWKNSPSREIISPGGTFPVRARVYYYYFFYST